MANAVITVNAYTIDNTQRFTILSGSLSVGVGNYPVGGLPLAAVLQALSGATGKLASVLLWSDIASGYIYQFVKATGNLMVLQPPPTASLTTAAPLQQLNSGATLSAVQADTIHFEARFLRNSQ
jgi:hypothetical protein